MNDQDRRLLDVRNRLVSLYGRVMDELSARDVVELAWSDTPPAQVTGDDAWKAAAIQAGWPLAKYPKNPLPPSSGYQVMGSGTRADAVMMVATFGKSPEEVASIIREIEARQSHAEDFNPVFLLDIPDFTAIGASGYTFEYFPKAQFDDLAARDRFRLRFQYLWQKWGATYLLNMSTPGYLSARIDNLADLIDPIVTKKTPNVQKPRISAPVALPADHIALRAEYESKGLDQRPDTFVLYRILGNDLPPRHLEGQTLGNLKFILDHEPEFENCEKRFVLNRIIDQKAEAALIALLEARGQSYDRIPFDLDAYGEVDWDVESFPTPEFFLRGPYSDMAPYDQTRAEAFARRHKNRYAINNNGARNFALREGRARAKWVLPWDGNCFLTQQAWQDLCETLRNGPRYKYVLCPMARVTQNEDLLDPDFTPLAEEEPQVVFRCDADESFDETLHYGRRPKVELFYRLGIQGPWSKWRDDIWDLPRPELSEDAGSAGRAGWVARLNSGRPEQEGGGNTGARARGETRNQGIIALFDRLDQEHLAKHFSADRLLTYDDAALLAIRTASKGSQQYALRTSLVRDGELALGRGPYSVTQKTHLAPSGDPHDYFHPAPYWWPNPDTPDGYPYVWRDGERIPGTRLYEPESDKYDRTRLQRMFDDTTILALAWSVTDDLRFAAHAADLIRTWFVDPVSRMNPHLRYAQPRSQKPDDEGSKSGLIEMKDLYFLLDAVRLVERAGVFKAEETMALKEWLRTYLSWLQTSTQGVGERASNNNHGTCFDLQILAIAAYLGDGPLIRSTLRTSRGRLLEQFEIDGNQPHEMKRSQSQHYTTFNLQCWVNLTDMADRLGDQLGVFGASDGRGLAAGFGWLFDTIAGGQWPFEQIEPFDHNRYYPLLHAARLRCGLEGLAEPLLFNNHTRVFFPHDGLRPYWCLGPRPSRIGTSATWEALPSRIIAAEHALTCEQGGTSPIRKEFHNT